MLRTLTLFVVFHVFLLANCDLLFKSRYERKNLELFRKLPQSPAVTEDRFKQKLDHFNPTDTRTWKQLFFTEKSSYSKGGPAYLWISGEGPASPVWLSGGYWQEHGKKNNAIFFLIEHRFYGSSQPFSDTSTDNLRYLSTPQALADLATFIIAMNKKHELPEDTKWIVFGGSYAGNLAAWMRLKYPHLVHGAVASSAPVLAQFNFPEYFDVVGDALVAYKKQCKNDIAQANKDLDKKVQTRKGRKEIGEIFKLCDPLKGNKLDAAYFLSNMADYFAGTVQYDHQGQDVKRACDKMLENSKNSNAMKRYSNVMNMFMESYGQSCLYTNFTDFIEDLKKTDFISSANTYRPWFYQTCTEYGYYQTSRQKNYLFSKRISLDFYEALCTKVFKTLFKKPFIAEAVDFTNRFFGGININSPRIVSAHGLLDPWHPLGVLSPKKTKNIDVVLIKGASHCNDLGFSSETDPDEVKKARAKIMNLLDAWLKEAK